MIGSSQIPACVQSSDACLCQAGSDNQHLEPVFNASSGFSPLSGSLPWNTMESRTICK